MAAIACTLSIATAAHAGSDARAPLTAPSATINSSDEATSATAGLPMLRPPADRPLVEISPAVGHVTVSRASDMVGRPVYAARQMFSGSDRVVAFSRRPVARLTPSVATLSTITLPGQLPLNATAMTSSFGYRWHPLLGGFRAHSGIDLAAPTGTPVFATADGTVSAAGWQGGYGLLVALNHPGALQTRYGHLSQINVTPGQPIRKGDVVGFVGSTGMSTGPHLHYEVRTNGRAVNPLGNGR